MRDMENNFLQIRQKQGTDSLLKNYLGKCDIKEDTIYAFLYGPAICPRCEASFKLFKKWLNERGKKFTLISVFEDSVASEYYNRKEGYDADYYIYDTRNDFQSIFSFNDLPLICSNVLKMTKTGRLITGGDYTEMSTVFVDQLIARTKPMDYKTFGTEDTTSYQETVFDIPNVETMKPTFKDYPVDSKGNPFCMTNNSPISSDNMFFYNDNMTNCVPVFKKEESNDTLSLAAVVEADSASKRAFVNIAEPLYQAYLLNGMVFSMVCNINMMDKSHIGVSYSLPLIKYEDKDSIRVALFNKPSILSFSTDDLSSVNANVPLEFDMFKDDYFYKHFQFSSTDDKIIIGCQKKTWPMEYEKEDYAADTTRNSFDKAFYKTDNPFMAAFDRKTGNLICRFGHLDESAERGLTGYFFVSPLSCVSGTELLYTDGYSGKVYIADTTNVSTEKECYKAFDPDYKLMPPIDSAKFYTYEYVKPYFKVYYRCIKNMRATKDKIYCLVKYHNGDDKRCKPAYTVITIDRKSRRTVEKKFPVFEGYSTFAYGLRTIGHDTVLPFMVLKNKNEVKVRVFND